MKNSLLKKIFSIALVSAMTVSIFTGCGSSSSGASSSGTTKILYTVCDNSDTFRSSLASAITSAAEDNHVTLDMKLSGDTVEKQVAQVASAKKKGYSAVIVRLTDASTALQIEVAADGLPVIFVNNQPDESRLSADKYIYAGSNEQEAGALQAKYVLKKLGNPKTMNVIILEGEKGHSGTIGRTTAVKNTLKDAGVDVNYAFVDYANWTTSEAKQKLDLFFKTGQDVDAIFCNNDNMALGAVQALKDQGIDPSSIPVCGVDATSEGCESISDHEMAFTAFQDAKGQGKAAVAAAIALGKGQSISSVKYATSDKKFIYVPFKGVDATNVSQYK